jgi:hypothetical protein
MSAPTARRVNSVEDRLHDVARTLALVELTARALAGSSHTDLLMTREATDDAWSKMADLSAEAFADVHAAITALPADASDRPAPLKDTP